MSPSVRKATLVGISIAAAAGLAGIAHATPIGIEEYKNHGQYVSEVAKTKDLGNETHGYYVSQAARNGGLTLLNTSTQSTSVQSVPEPKTMLLLGAGMLGLALWQLWSRRGTAA